MQTWPLFAELEWMYMQRPLPWAHFFEEGPSRALGTRLEITMKSLRLEPKKRPVWCHPVRAPGWPRPRAFLRPTSQVHRGSIDGLRVTQRL